jgi:RHS repeat-associated protein
VGPLVGPRIVSEKCGLRAAFSRQAAISIQHRDTIAALTMQADFIYDYISQRMKCALMTSRYTGKERDTESGNDYFGARYYASSMGRFMSPDPLGNQVAVFSNPQTWNMYSYALNNPLKSVDPTGTDWCAWDDGTHDDDPSDGGASQSDCAAQGGTWLPTVNQSVSVNGDTGQVDYTSDL